MLKRIAKGNKGDVGAMKQFVVLGIFILIGVIVYSNIFSSAGQLTATDESVNASMLEGNFSYTVTHGAYMYSVPTILVYSDGSLVVGTGATTNYTIDYGIGNLTIWNTSDTQNSAITATYDYSGSGSADGKTTLDSLNSTWYNAVNLLIIVFLVIAAVVILAYVGRIGGGGQ